MYRLAHGLVLAALLALAAPAHADLITFDDLSDSTGMGTTIPNGYKGFNWVNFSALNSSLYPPFSGYVHAALSSPMVAFNNGGGGALINSPTNFTFVGGNFAAAWNNGLQLQILGYDDGALVFNSTSSLNTGAATWINGGASSIDQLVFLASGGVPASPASSGTQFAMDNFTFTGGGGAVVAEIPEPGTLTLLALGCATVACGLARRRRKQAQEV